MQYLIIGAGPAGVNAAETLRKLDEEADIRILGDEPEPPYSRMAIPYLLMGNIEEQGTHLRDRADHFAVLNIEVTQARVQRVDPAAHQVVLESGDALAYDKLLIATGSSPARPPLPGIEGDNVSTCWNDVIAPDLRAGKYVLIAAHGNSLRALVKMLDEVSDEEITGFNIPTGIPLAYDLDDDLKPVAREFLGDPEAIAKAAAAVAAQGKAK